MTPPLMINDEGGATCKICPQPSLIAFSGFRARAHVHEAGMPNLNIDICFGVSFIGLQSHS